MTVRIEKDSMGELAVPQDALYGAQTQRAINNFAISGETLPKSFITALIKVKKAAALANAEVGSISQSISDAIVDACNALLSMENMMDHFPIDVYQTGSGTSTNMNANEVIAHLANQHLSKNSKQRVSPNDHVNYGQSSNDVIPTTIHVSVSIELTAHLLPALKSMLATIKTKQDQVGHYCKTGRTHLMDAMPVTFAQTLGAWAVQIQLNIIHIEQMQQSVQLLAQGGTAVGTGVNAEPQFASIFNKKITDICAIDFYGEEKPAHNYFALISSQDIMVALSGQLKTLAVSLMKIANDLRWMNSGPLAGLGEILLQALQPGSSIMPGKVNPVIPEATTMVCAQVIGNDSAITIAGQSGNFELNVMLPLIANNMLKNITMLSNASRALADNAIATFTVNEDKLNQALNKNPILVTALNPIIGYQKAAEIAKKAYKEKRAVIEVAAEMTDLTKDELAILLDPLKLTSNKK